MDFLVRLVREVVRRNLLRTLGIFVGGGWVVLQVMDLFIERGLLPEWTFKGALLALALGLPVVLATAFVQAGRRLAREGGEGVEEAESELARLFTWNRAALGGVLAFALLGAITAGYMVMRVTGIGAPGTLAAQGTFEVGGRVVLADFESSVGEAAPAELITEALRIDLEQSDAYDLVDPATVVGVLQRMRLELDDPLDEETAREVAVRLGASGVISGEIGQVGSSYILTSRLVAAESGGVLASFRQSARDADELIDMIDALARDMRTKVGESLRSVASSESLAAVTTNSLEALKKYSYVSSRVPRRGIDPAVSRTILDEAVALDSTFAAANILLAVQIRNWGGSPERAWEAVSQAYRHRARLSDRERASVEAYYLSVAGDRRGAMAAYRRIMELDPENKSAAGNLADLSMYAGDYETAIAALREREDRDDWVWSWNLITSLAAARRFDEAFAELDSMVRHLPEDQSESWVRGLLMRAADDIDGARAWNEAAARTATEDEWRLTMLGADLDLLSGNVAAAREKLAGLEARSRRNGNSGGALFFAGRSALARFWVEDDADAAAAALTASIDAIDLGGRSARDQDLPDRALIFALAGDETAVASTLNAYRAGVAPETDPEGQAVALAAERLIALRPGDGASFVALDRALDDIRCARCADLLRGVGAEEAGEAEAAIAAYERYLAHPFFDAGNEYMSFFVANVHERLGPLYEDVGDTEKAVEHYRRFAELWRNADAALMPRVEHARARVEVLASNE